MSFPTGAGKLQAAFAGGGQQRSNPVRSAVPDKSTFVRQSVARCRIVLRNRLLQPSIFAGPPPGRVEDRQVLCRHGGQKYRNEFGHVTHHRHGESAWPVYRGRGYRGRRPVGISQGPGCQLRTRLAVLESTSGLRVQRLPSPLKTRVWCLPGNH